MAAQTSLPIHLTEEDVAEMASPQIYDRGLDYFLGGQVLKLVRRGDLVHAEVQGSDYEPYQVTVEFDAGGKVFDTDCTCPYWDPVCKHVVAVLLTLVNEPDEVTQRPELETLLEGRSEEDLRAALLAAAKLHPQIVDDLEEILSTGAPHAAGAPGPSPTPPLDTAMTSRAIAAEIRSIAARGTRGYDSFGEYLYELDYERILQPYLDKVAQLLDGGQITDAAHAVAAVVDAWFDGLEKLDEWFWEDMQDEMDEAAAFLDRAVAEVILSQLLAGDSEAAREEWTELCESWDENNDAAFWISRIALEQGWDAPLVAAVLGGEITDQGLWEEEPPDWADELAQVRLRVLARAQRWQEYVYIAQAEGQHERIPIGLAHLERRAEALEEARSVFPSFSTQQTQLWLELAQTLWGTGAQAEAIQAAQLGLAQISSSPFNAPAEQLADWFKARAAELEDPGLVLEAAQSSFLSTFRLADYREVQRLAGARWPDLRQELMARLDKAPLPRQIDVYLHEDLLEEAIRAYDQDKTHFYRADPSLLTRLAEAARHAHPDWAIRRYEEEAAAIMDAGKAKHYEGAVSWLRRAREVYQEHNRLDEWRQHLAQIKAKHGRKYKLMGLLRAAFSGEI